MSWELIYSLKLLFLRFIIVKYFSNSIYLQGQLLSTYTENEKKYNYSFIEEMTSPQHTAINSSMSFGT